MPELRTQTSETFQQPDGTMRTRVSVGSMHFRDGGEWKKIDTDLVAGSNGTVSPAATGYDAELPRTLDDPVRVSKDGAGLA